MHRGPGRLQHGVVAEAVPPQPVVQAVHHAKSGPEARRRCAATDHRGFVGILRRQRKVHRRACRARGPVNPRHLVGRRCQVVPERRGRMLAGPQHLLVGERQLGQRLQPRRRRRAAPGPMVRRRVGEEYRAAAPNFAGDARRVRPGRQSPARSINIRQTLARPTAGRKAARSGRCPETRQGQRPFGTHPFGMRGGWHAAQGREAAFVSGR